MTKFLDNILVILSYTGSRLQRVIRFTKIAGTRYRPRRETTEGYVFTGVCHSVILGGGGVVTWSWCNTFPPRTRGGHNTPLPPGPGQVTTPAPHPLGPGQVRTTAPLPPRDCGQAGGTHPTGMHSCLIRGARPWEIIHPSLVPVDFTFAKLIFPP